MNGLDGRNVLDQTIPVQEKLTENPLICGIQEILGRITKFKEQARLLYFEVLLSIHRCPKCGGRLKMTGQSECTCSCGFNFDPTLAFQDSSCCGAKLVRKTFHYACSKCNKIIKSRFLFDERVFDKNYFREMMQASRRRAKHRREEIRRFLAETRSGALPIMEEPDLDAIPGLLQDLDDFIPRHATEIYYFNFDTSPAFNMIDYRRHIQSLLGWDGIMFSDVPTLTDDHRRDKIWRFITLVFMENDREIELIQAEQDIRVRKVYNETYN